jgi:hypothetical protein
MRKGDPGMRRSRKRAGGNSGGKYMIEQLTVLLPQQSQLTFPMGLTLGALLGGVIIEYYGHIIPIPRPFIKSSIIM